MFQEPFRNTTCPCESGRKFKHCCSANLSIEKAKKFTTSKETRSMEESQIQDIDKEQFFKISLEMNNGGKDFKKYLNELLKIKERNPNEPRIYNLITVCYGQIGKQTMRSISLKRRLDSFLNTYSPKQVS
jgi:hypothetical protein